MLGTRFGARGVGGGWGLISSSSSSSHFIYLFIYFDKSKIVVK